MNRQAKDILTILRVSGYYDSELTANLLNVVDKEASTEYLNDLDESFTNVSKHEGIAHELRVIRLKRKLADRYEEYESETFGQCGKCKKEYVRVNGSSCTRNADGTRYREPENFTAWNTFRCAECGSVINDNFEAV